ncbi:MAG: Abi family protein [Propionibacteriaceae bacterium]
MAGARFDDVIALYDFDTRLRAAVLVALAPIEIAIRTLIARELGCIHPLIHLDPRLLGPDARLQDSDIPSSVYRTWCERYQHEITNSCEDFVAHHRQSYGGKLPIWVAVETMDWGSLSYLYRLSPMPARRAIAQAVNLSDAQLGSWLKCLNIMRNIAAHHGRVVNRVYALKPKLPRHGDVDRLADMSGVMDRAFGQLSLVQYLLRHLGVGNQRLLPTVVHTFPVSQRIPLDFLGAPAGWMTHPLWR